MPEQKFSDPITGTELVSVHWDFGLTSVDVAFGGSLLTKISDIDQLRSTGLAGATPDGGMLLIKLGFGDKFEVFRNGQELNAADVNVFGHSPTPSGTALGDAKLSLDAAGRLTSNGKRVDEHAMGMLASSGRGAASAASAVSSGRGWLLFFSIVQTLVALLFGYLTFAVSMLRNKIEEEGARLGTGVESTEELQTAPLLDALFGFLQGVMAIVFLFVAACAVGCWVLWKVAGGPSARKAFTISKWVAVVYLVGTLIQLANGIADGKVLKAVLGALIPAAIEIAAFQAFRKAQSALPET